MRRFVRPWLAGLLVLVALLAWAGRPGWQLADVSRDPSPDALANDYLALGRYVAALGTDVIYLKHLPTDRLPPASGGVLWLPVPGAMLGEQRTRELLAWTRAGGTLVIAPQPPGFDEDDPLLRAVDISFSSLRSNEIDDVFGDKAPWSDFGEDGFPYRLDADRRVDASPVLRLLVASAHPDAEPLLCDPAGCHAVRVPFGAGAIVALADAAMFSNERLGQLDHARIAQEWLAPAPGRTLWLVNDTRVPTLFDLLWRHARWALLAALAATLLWVIASGTRFGPLRAAQEPARRRLAEHVDAVGRLLAQQGAQRALWQATRDHFLRTLHRRHPRARDGDEESIVVLIARHTGVAEADVRKTFVDVPDTQPAALAEAIARLETLRRKL